MVRMPFGQPISCEAGHNYQPGHQGPEHFQPNTQTAPHQEGLSLTAKHQFIRGGTPETLAMFPDLFPPEPRQLSLFDLTGIDDKQHHIE